MDLLFQRYASPFSFMDGMIQSGRFYEFVCEFLKTVNSEKEEQAEWEFYLHRVWEGSFAEFRESVKMNRDHQNMSQQTIETTVNESMNILKNFNPEKGVEKNGTI